VPKKNKTEPTFDPGVASSGGKRNKSKSRRKATGAKAAKKPSVKKAAGQKVKAGPPIIEAMEPSDEEIRTRAYFISERRRRLGLPGDASSDWLEAKKQLLSETGPR
jgi:hypothetical protein